MVGTASSGRKKEPKEKVPGSNKSHSAMLWASSVGRHINPDQDEDSYNEVHRELGKLNPGNNNVNEDILSEIKNARIIQEAENAKLDPVKIAKWRERLNLDQNAQPNTSMFGTPPQNQTQVTQIEQQMMLSQLMQNEPDPKTRQMMLISMNPSLANNNALMMSMMSNNNNQNNQNNQNQNNNNERNEITKIMFEMMKDILVQGKDKPDQLSQMTAMMQLMKEIGAFKGGNVDKMFDNVEKYKKYGIVADHESSVENRKLDIQEKTIDNDFKKYEIDRDSKADQDKQILDVVGNGIKTAISFGSGLLQQKASKQAVNQTYESPVQEEPEESQEPTQQSPVPPPAPQQRTTNFKKQDKVVKVNCQNPGCKNKDPFTVVLDKSKNFRCPHGCGASYVVDKEDKTGEWDVFNTQETEAIIESYNSKNTTSTPEKTTTTAPPPQQTTASSLIDTQTFI